MRQRGITVLEVVIALSVLTILVTAAFGGQLAQQQAVGRAYSELEAHRAASSRLDGLSASGAPLKSGSSTFEPLMRGAVGTQRVRRIEKGLYDVEVEVVHATSDVRAVLTTRIAREPQP